uniref:Putative salivary protein n=1 Tax=Ixodes scapularis TaxID=6945 RepID=Q4PMJ1_IXOSC|nr:putative salivary protein [Ixodes scapularis]
MQLVVFAVVLILPAFQSEGFSSGAGIHVDCMDIIDHAGERKCGLEGSGDLDDIDPTSCTLKCSGKERPKLPTGVCSGGEVVCGTFERESLLNWQQEVQHALHEVLLKWCPCYEKK